MTITKRGGRREGAGAKPKPPAEVASVRIVANVTEGEAAEWERRGKTKWIRAELRNRELQKTARPECYDFAMDFLGDPDAEEIDKYVCMLEGLCNFAKPHNQ